MSDPLIEKRTREAAKERNLGYYGYRENPVEGPRIVLKPMPADEAGIVVGTFQGKPLVFVGRVPTVGGHPMGMDVIGPALANALVSAADKVFGSDWAPKLALVLHISSRSLGLDRVSASGLPPTMLKAVGEMAAAPNPRALGYALLAAVEMTNVTGSTDGLRGVASAALDMADRVRAGREAFASERVAKREAQAPEPPGI